MILIDNFFIHVFFEVVMYFSASLILSSASDSDLELSESKRWSEKKLHCPGVETFKLFFEITKRFLQKVKKKKQKKVKLVKNLKKLNRKYL